MTPVAVLHPDTYVIPADQSGWVRSLLEVRELLNDEIDVLTSWQVIGELQASGTWPSLVRIKELVDSRTWDVMSIDAHVRFIMERSHKLEDKPYAIDLSDYDVDPDDALQTCPTQECARSFAETAVVGSLLAEPAAVVWPRSQTDNLVVRVSGIWVTEVGEAAELAADSMTIGVARSRWEYYRGIALNAEMDLRQELYSCLAKQCVDPNCFATHSAAIRLHPSFEASEGMAAAGRKVRLNALNQIGRIVHEGPREVSKPFRAGPRQSDPLVTSVRHGGEGRRYHLTKSGVGWRLNFWLGDDFLELVSVAPKGDESIDDSA